jgi:hypothetical protein
VYRACRLARLPSEYLVRKGKYENVIGVERLRRACTRACRLVGLQFECMVNWKLVQECSECREAQERAQERTGLQVCHLSASVREG